MIPNGRIELNVLRIADGNFTSGKYREAVWALLNRSIINTNPMMLFSLIKLQLDDSVLLGTESTSSDLKIFLKICFQRHFWRMTAVIRQFKLFINIKIGW